MDISNLLYSQAQAAPEGSPGAVQLRQHHPYPTRSTNSANAPPPYDSGLEANIEMPMQNGTSLSSSTTNGTAPKMPPKTVNFQLLLSHVPQHRARLPLRVHIQPHDTTDSIITTVKNFYGLYEGEGVSFQDNAGDTLIAQYENLANNTTVYVRITSEEPVADIQARRPSRDLGSPKKPHLDEPIQLASSQPFSRPSSRAAKTRDLSPQSVGGRRSASARAQLPPKPRYTHDEIDAAQGLSDSDGGSVSVSSSRRAKSDHLASAEISLDNILEGGRRKKAKFESSELPLFAPPQQPMTTSLSSLSPQRRFTNNSVRSPLSFTNQYTFSYNPILPTPQSLGQTGYATPKTASVASGHLSTQVPLHSHQLRGGAHRPSRLSGGAAAGVLPTPDPTISSIISDEDVALQLMRLGDPSNQSHGRTSTSTVDDALSGKAEVASSADGSSDDMEADRHHRHGLAHMPSYSHGRSNHHGEPARKKHKGSATMLPRYSSDESSGDEMDYQMGAQPGFGAGPDHMKQRAPKYSKVRAHSTSSKGHGKLKHKQAPINKNPQSPYSGDQVSRNGSNASSTAYQQQLGEGEEDLSAKPRCQRCRKSKKGCDRQRPCQRCKDAGIGIEGCISEDEGNGRKGRYGRHMGVPIGVKRSSMDELPSPEELPGYTHDQYLVDAGNMGENGKKRKR